MSETLSFITPAVLALVPIVIGLVEVIKILGVSSRYAPVASILLGVGMSWLFGGTLTSILIGGIVVGLTASGLYSGTVALNPRTKVE